jgi:hypothetical protein
MPLAASFRRFWVPLDKSEGVVKAQSSRAAFFPFALLFRVVESSRPGEKILASALAVHTLVSVLPIASMIPMLATELDLATKNIRQ